MRKSYERLTGEGNHINGWRKSYQLTAEVISTDRRSNQQINPTPINNFDGFHIGKPILGLHYDPENAFFAPF